MALSPSKKKATGQIQVSFIIHTVVGEHLESQAVIVSVNENTFILEPKTKRGNTRYYEAGYTTFIEVSSDIRFGVAIVTPNDHGKYFFHTFTYYDFKPSIYPTLQKLTMSTPAKSYELTVSLFSTPFNKSSPSSPSITSYYSTRTPSRARTSVGASFSSTNQGRYSSTYSTPRKTQSSLKSAPSSPSRTSPVKTKY